ncbi:MAG TPA: CAP domain-containing protein [Thermoleophilaceae bacterium]|jgi:uncharacterized protein YkwD
MRKLGISLALMVALAAAPSSASAAPACAGASAVANKTSTHKLVRNTLCLLNAERRKHGLRKLRLSKRLSLAARKHSRDMVRRDYFAHNSLSGASFVDRIKRTGYLHGAMGWMVGENLAWGAGSRSSAAKIVKAWMHSPGHRHNILTGTFRHIGIGIVPGAPASVGGMPAATYTTDFGFKHR